MTSVAAAVITVAALQAGAVWIAVRAIAGVDLQTLPARLRNRMQWWLLHHRHAYAACAVAFAAGGLAQLAHCLS
jgi:hypothetical protein